MSEDVFILLLSNLEHNINLLIKHTVQLELVQGVDIMKQTHNLLFDTIR